MRKNESGVSMLSLAITIIVLFIIAGITTYAGTKVLSATKLEDLKTNLLLIQTKIKIKSEEYNFKKEEDAIVGNIVSQDIIDKLGIENADKVRSLSQNNLNDMGLQKIKGDNRYVVNYENSEIYFVDGFKTKDGKVYYKLSDIENLSISDNELSSK